MRTMRKPPVLLPHCSISCSSDGAGSSLSEAPPGSPRWCKQLSRLTKGAWAPAHDAVVGFRIVGPRGTFSFTVVVAAHKIRRIEPMKHRGDFVVEISEQVAREVLASGDRTAVERAMRSGGVRLEGRLDDVVSFRHWLGPGETAKGQVFLAKSLDQMA